MTPNDAPPLSEEEIADLRACLYPLTVRAESSRRLFARLVAERDSLKAEVDSLERSNSQLRWMVEETIREHAPDRAEVERLREAAKTYLEEGADLNTKLSEEIERLKADGERLDWLSGHVHGQMVPESDDDSESVPQMVVDWVDLFENDLRAAIDLARKAQGGE